MHSVQPAYGVATSFASPSWVARLSELTTHITSPFACPHPSHVNIPLARGRSEGFTARQGPKCSQPECLSNKWTLAILRMPLQPQGGRLTSTHTPRD